MKNFLDVEILANSAYMDGDILNAIIQANESLVEDEGDQRLKML